MPEKDGVTPGYEQKFFPDEEKRKSLRLIASRDGRNGSITINQDTNLYAALPEVDEEVIYPVPKNRHVWLQVALGSIAVKGSHLAAGDGAAVSGEDQLIVAGTKKAEILLFDLA